MPRKPVETAAMGHTVVGRLPGGWRPLGLSIQHVKSGMSSSRASQGTLAAPEKDLQKSWMTRDYRESEGGSRQQETVCLTPVGRAGCVTTVPKSVPSQPFDKGLPAGDRKIILGGVMKAAPRAVPKAQFLLFSRRSQSAKRGLLVRFDRPAQRLREIAVAKKRA